MRRPLRLAVLVSAALAAVSGAAGAAEPRLMLSLNLGLAADAVPGGPLIVTGSLASSDPAAAAPLRIAPARGTWVEALELVLARADGSRVAAPFALAGVAADPALELAGRARVRLLWTLPAAAAGRLAPGDYLLQARLTVPQSAPGSWSGTVESPPLRFAAPPSGGSDDIVRRRARALLTANLAAVDGDFAGAEGELRALLRQDSGCVAAHRLLAEVLLARDAPLEAVQAASDAAGLWRKANPGTPLPPPEIIDVGQRAIRAILAAAPAAVQQPAVPQPAQGAAPAPAAPPPAQPADEAKTKALRDYRDTVAKGDALHAAGDFFEAVLAYERAWRVRYNSKLDVPAAELDERLARARKARDEKKKR